MTNAEARFNNSLRPRKPEGSLGRTAQDGHLDSHTAPELCLVSTFSLFFIACPIESKQQQQQQKWWQIVAAQI